MTTILGGRYRLGEVLGAGGMGQVFAATDERLDRAVAVKVLRGDLARDPAARERFRREARAAARLSHPNVVAVYDTGIVDGGGSYLVMERCSGATLLDEMQAGPLPPARLDQVAHDVTAALAAAHRAGVLHRDVKPANVLVARDGRLKVADFGIAKTLDLSETLTVGAGFGTPAYTAPERLRGEPATTTSDVWSLGVLLYEAATGERPLAGAHRPLRELRPDVDPRFADAVEQMLQPDPALRPQDGAVVLRALGGIPAAAPVDGPVDDPTAAVAGDPDGDPTFRDEPTARADATAALPTPTRVLPVAVAAQDPAPHPAPDRRRAPAGSRRRTTWVLAATGAALGAALLVALLVAGTGGDAGPGRAPAATTTTTPVAAVTTAPPATTVPPTQPVKHQPAEHPPHTAAPKSSNEKRGKGAGPGGD
jgi:serine/threonine-protein kinase